MYDVKINKICITLVYLRNTISKKMRNFNVKLIIEVWFKFCYIIKVHCLWFYQIAS